MGTEADYLIDQHFDRKHGEYGDPDPAHKVNAMVGKVRVRKTPCGLHPYVATMRGKGTYGWGNTPNEARECLTRRLREEAQGALNEWITTATTSTNKHCRPKQSKNENGRKNNRPNAKPKKGNDDE